MKTLVLLFTLISFAGAADRPWSNLKQLETGQKVRVIPFSGRSVKGRFDAYTDEAVSIQVKDKIVTVERKEIRKITAGSALRRLRNTGIGAGIGAGAGAAIAVPAVQSLENLGVLGAALAVFAAGTITGALLPANRTIYEVRPKQSVP